MGGIAATFLVWWIARTLARVQANRLLNTHPPHRAGGRPALEITADRVRFASAVAPAPEMETWPLGRVTVRPSSPNFLILVSSGKLVAAIPSDAVTDPAPFSFYRRAVRRRIWRYSISAFFLFRANKPRPK